MKEGHELRWGGIAGILALIVAIIARIVAWNAPGITEHAGLIGGYVGQHRGHMLWAALLTTIAAALFLWFGVALAAAFRRGEARHADLTDMAGARAEETRPPGTPAAGGHAPGTYPGEGVHGPGTHPAAGGRPEGVRGEHARAASVRRYGFSDLPALVLAGFVVVVTLGFVGAAVYAGTAYVFSVNRGLLPLAAVPYTGVTLMGLLSGIAWALLFAAIAGAIIRTAVLPQWMAWFAIIVAIIAFLSALALGITGGVLAPRSFLVGWLPMILVGLWTLVASGLLIREHLPFATRTVEARPAMGH
ncbi:hypothetical protein SAMN05421505_101338 [Sinosporangium album]|uniref:Uncharacterized protein n=1 Tax=Sinosporangium album TaxID=504805 RepID=A0A1G7RBH3_9ACTN|nr:hypothetical protein [Sinosporangium album]SDG08073.1 hypothetical protein SAMN05421505_101338 [Sinosporangium album]